MVVRKLRKVVGRSNALMSVYECDSCLWLLNVVYQTNLTDVELKFAAHDCTEKPLRSQYQPPAR